MSSTLYGDISPRTAAYAEKELLKRGLPFLVLEKFGQAKTLPDHSTKVMKFRRYNALPTNPVALSEGVTPGSRALSVTDVTATLTQYGDVVEISDVILDTHEDPTLNEAVAVIGEQAAQMIEKMRFGVIKAGTNVIYGNGASRSAVVTPMTGSTGLQLQRRAVRALKRQNARFITSVIRSTPSYGTENVAPGFVAMIHPDLEADVRGLPGFVPAEKYGSMTPWENELGKVEDVRYVSSTVFEAWANAGGAAGGTLLSTGGTSADVYPILLVARDAYAIIALKGAFAVTPSVVNPKPSDSDPLAQRGKVGWKAMQTAVILNDAFQIRIEVAASA